MHASLLASLPPSDRHLVSQSDPKNLATLDEDEVLDLHDRLRRARNKAVSLYRRGGASKVSEKGGRGKAKQQNQTAALRVEAFEEALSRTSRRVTALSRQAAADLKAERIAAARAAKGGVTATPKEAKSGKPSTTAAKRPNRTTAVTKRRADTLGQGARRQAKRDNKGR